MIGRGRVKALVVGTAISLVFASSAATAGAAKSGLPEVAIESPSPGTSTSATSIDVVVGFRATGNVQGVALEVNGTEVGRRPNPPKTKEGTASFPLDLTTFADGDLVLQAFAWQGNERAGIRTASAPVTMSLHRGPSLETLAVASVPDEAHRASATLGSLGGTLATDDSDGTHYELFIPPGALLAPTALSFAPTHITGLESVAASTRFAVDFAPAGLHFAVPATLTITPFAGAPSSTGDFTASWEATPGIEVGVPALAENGSLRIVVPHFSGVTTLRANIQSQDNMLTLALISTTGISGSDLAALQAQIAGLPDTAQAVVDQMMQLHNTIVSPAIDHAGDDVVALRVAATRLHSFGILYQEFPTIGTLAVTSAPPAADLDGVRSQARTRFITAANAFVARYLEPACSAPVAELADWFAVPIATVAELAQFNVSAGGSYCASAAVEPGPFPATIDPSQQFVSGSFQGVVRAPAHTPGGLVAGSLKVFPQPTSYSLHSSGARFAGGDADVTEISGADGRIEFLLDRGPEPRSSGVAVTGEGTVGGFWADVEQVVSLDGTVALALTVGPQPETRIAFRSPPVGQYLEPGGATSLCVDVNDAEGNGLIGTTVNWTLDGPGSLPLPSTPTNGLAVACAEYHHPEGEVLEGITASITASASANGAPGSASVTLFPRWARIEIEVRPDSAADFVAATNSTVSIGPAEGATLRLTATGGGATPADSPVPLAGADVGVEITAGGGRLLERLGDEVVIGVRTDDAGQQIVTFDPNGSSGDTQVGFLYPAAFSSGVVATVTLDRTSPPVVLISPLRPSVGFGEDRQFTATVQNTLDPRVTWTATGGVINQSGTFTAGNSPGTFSVTATSDADPSASTTTPVQVTSPTIEGRYTGVRCFTGASPPAQPCGELDPVYNFGYFCNLQSGTATVCGWINRDAAIPHVAPFCQIDTDGTLAGGAFIGRISFCGFGLNENHLATRIEGTIGNGSLTFTVFGPDPFDGEVRAIEHYAMYKTF